MCKFDHADATGYQRVVEKTLKVWTHQLENLTAEEEAESSRVYQTGSTFGSHNSGQQFGNVYSAGPSPVNKDIRFHSGASP